MLAPSPLFPILFSENHGVTLECDSINSEDSNGRHILYNILKTNMLSSHTLSLLIFPSKTFAAWGEGGKLSTITAAKHPLGLILKLAEAQLYLARLIISRIWKFENMRPPPIIFFQFGDFDMPFLISLGWQTRLGLLLILTWICIWGISYKFAGNFTGHVITRSG